MRVFTPLSKHFDRSCRDFGTYTDAPSIFGTVDRLFFHYRYEKVYRRALSRYAGQLFDLLHAHSLFSNGYVAWKLSQQMKRPFIVAVRDTDINVFFAKMPHLRALGRAILRDAARVVFLSPVYRDEALRPYLSESEFEAMLAKSVVLPNGVDAFWLQNKGVAKTPPEGEINLLLVGQIIKRKNIPAAAEAAKALNARGVRAALTVVGKPVNARLAASLRAMAHVTLLPARPQNELLPLYRAADIFILPSPRETFGLVYAEALTQGLPVLYSRKQGFDGQFEAGVVGYPIDPHDPSEMADRVEDILKNYRAISENCLRGCARFDWTDICSAYQALYEQVTSPIARKVID